MKRDIFLKNNITKNVLLFLLCFGFGLLILTVLLLILAGIEMKSELSDVTLKKLLTVFLGLVCALNAVFYRLLSKIRGIFAGLITACVWSILKLIAALSGGGIGKSSVLIYVVLFCSGLLGGIVAANQKTTNEKKLVKLNKSY